jgi:hypothetical protein
MRTLRILITTLCLFVAPCVSLGDVLFSNPITGTNPSTDNPFTAGQTVISNITVSGIGRGSGINANNAANRYNANSWDSAGIDLTAYFTWTLTPSSGFLIDFSDFVYSGQASGSGPTSFAFRSSVDGFTADIGAPTAGGTTINLSGASFQNITSSVEFRLYGWGASASGGTFSVNDFTFNGTVAAVPEASAFVFGGMICMVAGLWSVRQNRLRMEARS